MWEGCSHIEFLWQHVELQQLRFFINSALNHYFSGNRWNFNHIGSRHHALDAFFKVWVGGSEVIEKLNKRYPSRLPAALYSNAS